MTVFVERTMSKYFRLKQKHVVVFPRDFNMKADAGGMSVFRNARRHHSLSQPDDDTMHGVFVS